MILLEALQMLVLLGFPLKKFPRNFSLHTIEIIATRITNHTFSRKIHALFISFNTFRTDVVFAFVSAEKYIHRFAMNHLLIRNTSCRSSCGEPLIKST